MGVHITAPEQDLYGFGYPNVQVADQKTRFVWRTLEFGLGALGDRHPEAPRGEHLLPRRRWFTTDDPRTAILQPLQPGGQEMVVGKGVPPKRFLRDAFDEMTIRYGNEMRKLASVSFK